MGVFDDKKFDGLDWISQATEPIDSQLNVVLGLLPEVIQVDFRMYNKITDSYGLDLSLGRAIMHSFGKLPHSCTSIGLNPEQLNALEKCFKFELTGDEIFLNYETQKIEGGEITLIKLNSTMDEKVLESMLGREGINSLNYGMFNGPQCLSRSNEIMELLGKCEEGLRTRSERRKRVAIVKRLQLLFKNNEWKIKDTELANKVGYWIKDYICDGNLAAFSNFCRLKVMTHKDQPIYSMEEVE